MSLSDRIKGANLNRRAFVAAASAGFAGLVLEGCQPGETGLSETGEPSEENKPFEEEGRWIPAGCWLNCGGRCYNSAYVVDGVVKYQKTDDIEADSVTSPQQRGCVRGRSQRHQVYAPDRIKYPMKRKNWSPENPNKELRGKDEWERISWDEALDYVADQLKAAIAKSGNRSILLGAFGDLFSSFYQSLNAIGGKTQINDTSSMGCYSRTCDMLGLYSSDMHAANDRYDLLKSDTIVLQGCNPVWSSPGNPNYYLYQAKKAGAQFVVIGPSRNASADLFDAKWIPVRPGTDTAFMLAVAYVMLAEDDPENNPLIDWDFMNRCTVGFDLDHMPSDATTQECLSGYLQGEYDGVPKTPEWASEICGTPVEDIVWYAHQIGCQHNVSLLHSYSFARCNDADDVPQLFMTLGCLGGHFGKEGNCCGSVYHAMAGNSGPSLVAMGADGVPSIPNPVDDAINATDLWDAVLTGKYKFIGNAFADPSSVEERDIDIQVIYHMWRNGMQTIMGTKKAIEAHRAVNFVVYQGYDFNASASYADILLPASTQWERFSNYFYLTYTGRECQLFPSKVIEPLWESKTDEEIGRELLKRFDIDPDEIYPVSEAQGYFNMIAGSKVVQKAGEEYKAMGELDWFTMLFALRATLTGGDYQNLVTITQEDLDRLGFEGTPQEGLISYDDLMAAGKYQVPRTADDDYGYIAYESFRNDPEGHPVGSASGKFEIYCQTKADGVNAMGYGSHELKPYPTYRPALHGYEESFSDWGAKVKGEFPYQMYNPHYLRRGHTGFDNIPQLRETWENPVYISAQDALEKGVADGDTVLVTSPAGKCLRHATVTERIMPGCVALPHGTWIRLDENEEIDQSGSDNWMLAPETSGCGVSGYNTNLVNFEKWNGDALKDDQDVIFEPVGGIE